MLDIEVFTKGSDRSSPCLSELLGVGEDAIALSSALCHPEMMEVGEGANVFR